LATHTAPAQWRHETDATIVTALELLTELREAVENA
jgi:hypothetical protein